MQSALVGVVFWVASYIPVKLGLPYEAILGFSLADKTLISCFLCFPLSVLALVSANWMCDREKALFQTAYDIGAFSEVLFQESMIDGELVEITTQNRKVYVGYILEYRHDLTSSYNEIFLVPVMSGYRTDIKMKVEFTTHYIPIYLEQLTGVDADQLGELLVQMSIYSHNKFRLVIPVYNCPRKLDHLLRWIYIGITPQHVEGRFHVEKASSIQRPVQVSGGA